VWEKRVQGDAWDCCFRCFTLLDHTNAIYDVAGTLGIKDFMEARKIHCVDLVDHMALMEQIDL